MQTVGLEDNLEVIREEQTTPLASLMENEEAGKDEAPVPSNRKCICPKPLLEEKEEKQIDSTKLLLNWQQKENELREKYEKELEKKTSYLKERFNFVLQ